MTNRFIQDNPVFVLRSTPRTVDHDMDNEELFKNASNGIDSFVSNLSIFLFSLYNYFNKQFYAIYIFAIPKECRYHFLKNDSN